MERASRTETQTRTVGRLSDGSDWEQVEEPVVVVTVTTGLGSMDVRFVSEPTDEELLASLPVEWRTVAELEMQLSGGA